MNARRPTRARGAALLALLAVIALGSSWYLVSRLNAESGSAAAVRKQRDAEVLNRAKQALIGYVAAQAANSGEDNPGALPCPEAAGYFDNPANEGQTASGCSLPKVGRFPWRTIGTEKLLDSAGEPLWYVVSPGWAATTSGGKTNINSNSLGQLTVDGTPNAAVALIIAPGPAFSVPACGAFPAKVQARPTTGTPDWSNYLECENSNYPTPDASFVTRSTSSTFNDQVVVVTVADIMPGIEAAVAKRIERDIVPTLKTVYANTQWGSGISATTPMFPFAAPWSTSTYGPGPGTVALPSSNYRGTAGTYQGLLPFNQTQGCTESTADPRCTTATTGGTAFLVFSKPFADVQTAGGGSIRTQASCSWVSTTYVCTGEYFQPTIAVSLTIDVTNVAMGLRSLDLTKVVCTAKDDAGGGIGTQSVPCVSSVAMQTNGSARLTVATSTMPDITASGWGTYANYVVSIDRAVFGDHALLDSTAATTGWFARNEWYRLLYYATTSTHTSAQLPGTLGCTAGTNCLTVTNLTPSPTNNKRALLVLAGRSLSNSSRPNGTLSDFVEFDNADGNSVFEKQPISRAFDAAAKKPFNDRVIVLDSN